jgi:hypothetical protein
VDHAQGPGSVINYPLILISCYLGKGRLLLALTIRKTTRRRSQRVVPPKVSLSQAAQLQPVEVFFLQESDSHHAVLLKSPVELTAIYS